jgi:hypothetical protein
MADTDRPRDRLVTWVDAKSHEHEVPAYVAQLLQQQYRGQVFVGTAAKKILAFFNEEPLFLQKNTLTKDPADTSQVKTRCVDLLGQEPTSGRSLARAAKNGP